MRDVSMKKETTNTTYVILVQKYKLVPDFNMGYYSEYIYAEALSEDGTIVQLNTKKQYSEISGFLNIFNSKHFTTGSIIVTDAEVRTDYVEMFNSKRGRGKTYFSILHEISEEICKKSANM